MIDSSETLAQAYAAEEPLQFVATAYAVLQGATGEEEGRWDREAFKVYEDRKRAFKTEVRKLLDSNKERSASFIVACLEKCWRAPDQCITAAGGAPQEDGAPDVEEHGEEEEEGEGEELAPRASPEGHKGRLNRRRTVTHHIPTILVGLVRNCQSAMEDRHRAAAVRLFVEVVRERLADADAAARPGTAHSARAAKFRMLRCAPPDLQKLLLQYKVPDWDSLARLAESVGLEPGGCRDSLVLYVKALLGTGRFAVVRPCLWLVTSYGLLPEFGTTEYVGVLIDGFKPPQVESAEVLAGANPEAQHHLIELFLRRNQTQAAFKTACKFDLVSKYPDLRRRHKENNVRRSVQKGKLDHCIMYVEGREPYFQQFLVKELFRHGRVDDAAHIAERFGIEPGDVFDDPEDVRMVRVAGSTRGEKYLPCPLGEDHIVMVSTEEDVAAARERIGAELRGEAIPAVGLDTEWKNHAKKAGQSRTAILQLSTRTTAYILDTIALHNLPEREGGRAVDSLLRWVFRDGGIVKVGFGWGEDMKKLRSSYPEAACYEEMNGLLEMRKCAPHWGVEGNSQKNGVSLSLLVSHAAGKALDKTERLSDWEARPLSPAQLRYAAMDAYALLLCLDWAARKGFVTPEGVGALTETLSFAHIHKKAIVMDVPAAAGRDRVALTAEALGLRHFFVPVDGGTSTAAEVRASGADLGNAVPAKTVIFSTGAESAVAVITEGSSRVKMRALAAHLDIKKKRIELCPADRCEAMTGYKVGDIPPFGHTTPLPVYIDASLAGAGMVYASAGGPGEVVVFDLGELARLDNRVHGHLPGKEDSAAAMLAAARAVAGTSGEPGGADGAGGPRFVVDVMLGRLARWMRCLGMDTLYLPEKDYDKLFLLSKSDDRVVVTKDRHFLERKEVAELSILYIESHKPVEQIHQVMDHFGLRYDEDTVLTRCSKCNGRFAEITKERVRESGKVLERVLEQHDLFYQCTNCLQIFWQGPQFVDARNMFHDMIKGMVLPGNDDDAAGGGGGGGDGTGDMAAAFGL